MTNKIETNKKYLLDNGEPKEKKPDGIKFFILNVFLIVIAAKIVYFDFFKGIQSGLVDIQTEKDDGVLAKHASPVQEEKTLIKRTIREDTDAKTAPVETKPTEIPPVVTETEPKSQDQSETEKTIETKPVQEKIQLAKQPVVTDEKAALTPKEPGKVQVNIKVNAPAQIFVNNKYVGDTPALKNLSLAPGSYKIRYVKQGEGSNQSVEKDIVIKRTGAAFVIGHEFALTGKIEKIVAVPWGRVYVDNQFIGLTPLKDISLTAGKHTIRVENPNFETYSENIVVVADQNIPIIQTKLVKKGSPVISTTSEVSGKGSPAYSTIQIITVIPWGKVFIDDRLIGNSPLKDIKVTPGEHVIRVENPVFEVYTKNIVVVADQNIPLIQARLVKKTSPGINTGSEVSGKSSSVYSTIQIITVIPWGKIFIDDRFIGNSPQKDIKVTPGEHVIRVENPGFYTYTHKINVEEGKDIPKINIILQKGAQ